MVDRWVAEWQVGTHLRECRPTTVSGVARVGHRVGGDRYPQSGQPTVPAARPMVRYGVGGGVMRPCFHITVLLAVAHLAGCAGASPPPPTGTGAQPVKMTYPYAMSEENRRAFLDNVRALHPRQPLNEIVAILGSPDSRYTISAKEHGRPLGIRICYYLKKIGDGVNEKYDQSVDLDLDNGGRLLSIGLQNLPELAGRITGLPVTASRWDDSKKRIEVNSRNQGIQ